MNDEADTPTGPQDDANPSEGQQQPNAQENTGDTSGGGDDIVDMLESRQAEDGEAEAEATEPEPEPRLHFRMRRSLLSILLRHAVVCQVSHGAVRTA